jgi:hypothetical protein
LDDEIGRVRVGIEEREASLERLRPKIGRSTVHAEQFDILADELAALRKKRAALEDQRASTRKAADRWEATWRLMRQVVGPALRGDVAARDRLRGMLAAVPFRIEGAGSGSLVLECDGWSDHVLAEADAREVALRDAAMTD